MKKIITFGIIVIIGVALAPHLISYLQEDDCKALLAQYQAFKDKGWYATRDKVETCKKFEIELPEYKLSRF